MQHIVDIDWYYQVTCYNIRALATMSVELISIFERLFFAVVQYYKYETH